MTGIVIMEKIINERIYELIKCDTTINTPCRQCAFWSDDKDCDEAGNECWMPENADKSWQLKPTHP
jgi:hypothetical protein